MEKENKNKELKISYEDTSNKNISISVHKNGTAFINVHNVVSITQKEEEEKGYKTLSIISIDEEGNNTYTTFFINGK